MKSQINGLFYCEHLSDSEEHKKLLESFCVIKKEGIGLEHYLKYGAINDELAGTARTYLVRDIASGELVGYFSLKAGAVTVNEKIRYFIPEFDIIPGIELANFAVNGSYKETHKEVSGIGQVIFFYFIRQIVKEVADIVGVKVLYIFALPQNELINHYAKMNFSRLDKKTEKRLHRRIKPRYDERCIFMYQLVE